MAERIQLSASAENISGFVQHSYEDVIDFLNYFLDFINLKNPRSYVSFSNEASGNLFVQNLLDDSGVQFLFDGSAYDLLKDYIYMTPVGPNVIPWGSFYQTNFQSLIQTSEKLSSQKAERKKIPLWVIDGNKSDWIYSLKKATSEVDSKVRGLFFKDDLDYQLAECELDKEIRLSLAQYRAKFILQNEPLTEVSGYCRVFPPWFNRIEIKSLGLSARTCNALNASGVFFIFNFNERSNQDILRFPNMGPASFNELLEKLKDLLESFLILTGLVATSIHGQEDEVTWPQKNLKNKSAIVDISPESEFFVVKGNSKTWLRDFIINHPDCESNFQSLNIVDDVQYQVNEAKLSNELRVALANHRFKFLLDVVRLSDLKDYVRLLPPWVNKSPIDRLNLNVRSHNCLISVGYKFIADLRNKDNKQLLQIDNFGKGTLQNITEALKEIFEKYDSDDGLVKQSFRWDILSNTPSETSSDNSHVQDFTWQGFCLIDAISLTIQTIDNTQAREVIALRLGVRAGTETLQQIAEKIGVTRERVRQIESKAKKIFLNRFPINVELERRLDFIRDGMFLPLTVQSLSTYDEWFQGIEKKPWLMDALLSMFSVGNYKVHDFQGQKIVAPGDRGFVEDSLKLIKEYVKSGIDKRITKSGLLKIVQDFVGVVTPELVDLVFYEICQSCIFTKELDDERLVAFSSGVSSHILAILEESDVPLKVDDLQNICNQKFSLGVELPYIRGRAAEVAYLFAPSTFGTIKHLDFLPEEINQINSEVLEIMLAQVSGRQWHCDELLDLLQDDLPSIGSRLNKYKLAICLSLSNKFQSLGRMVFSLQSEGGGVIARRIDFYKFVEAVLERSKVPMHRDEIMAVIKQERGLSEFSQIFNSGRLISVDIATWALQDKHLGITDDKFIKISEEIKNILISHGAGLSQDELVTKIDSEMLAYEFKNNPHLLFSIATKSKVCKKIDIYIYLSEWGSCRRVTMKQSIFEALIELSQKGSFTARGVWELAESKYQNKIPRLFINKEITDAGAIYDKENNYWTYKR